MSKLDHNIWAAFAPQVDDVTYNAGLDAITTAIEGDPNGTDDGLLLGDSASGEGGSGIDFSIGRNVSEKPRVLGSYTRLLADLNRADVPSFTFAFPWVGPKRTTAGTPVNADFVPLKGVDALCNGAGLVAAAAGSGVGYDFEFGSPYPFSALVYYFGNRLELRSCRCSGFEIKWTPGGIAIATATIVVGDIKDPSADGITAAAAMTTVNYAVQATVSNPVVQQVGNLYSVSRGFSELALRIEQTIAETPDSNAVDGIVKEIDDREVSLEGTLYVDDAAEGEVYDLNQIFANAAGDLDDLSFTVGDAATGSDPALATEMLFTNNELSPSKPVKLGAKAATTVTLRPTNTVANKELTLTYR